MNMANARLTNDSIRVCTTVCLLVVLLIPGDPKSGELTMSDIELVIKYLSICCRQLTIYVLCVIPLDFTSRQSSVFIRLS